jgi:5-hydroxyisourate hydrolase
MGKLSTHVLDTAYGHPAAGMAFALYRVGQADPLREGRTNAEGRADGPLLEGTLEAGCYELVFEVAAYFRQCGVTLPEPPFLDRVTLAFGISEPEGHYHVPLLISPWSYSTYRGS